MKRIKIAIIISLSITILIAGDHYIDKYLGGGIHFISICLILILTIVTVIYIIKELINIFRHRNNLTATHFLPIIIYVGLPFLSGYIHLDKLESKAVMRACYEGTQNQAYVLFRKDKTFEVNWTGAFFYDEWFTGHWERRGDTITLKYDNKPVEKLGNTVVIKNNFLVPISTKPDTATLNNKFTNAMGLFYLGYCKGEN